MLVVQDDAKADNALLEAQQRNYATIPPRFKVSRRRDERLWQSVENGGIEPEQQLPAWKRVVFCFDKTWCCQGLSVVGGTVPEFSLVYTIAAVQVLVYIAEGLYSMRRTGDASNILVPDSCTLFEMGAKFSPAIQFDHEFYRLLFPLFLHGSFPHLFLNTFVLFSVGNDLELRDTLPKWRFASFYLYCGICGNLLSAIMNPYALSVGSSTALFGLMGFEAVVIFHSTDQTWRSYTTLAINICLSLMFAATVDLYGHLGGSIAGVLSGPVLYYGYLSSFSLMTVGSTAFLASIFPFILITVFLRTAISDMNLSC